MPDRDVAVVGGGPAGATAAVFLARRGLDTVVFDRGRSSIARCAHLENYPGFPGGIDVGTLYDLLHDHVGAAGAAVVDDMVESVERLADGGDEGGEGFLVRPQEGDPVTARRVVAATRYDGEYLRGLDDEDAMFEEHEHDGETHETFVRDYADRDGTTPVEGLYVASPSDEADMQAVVAAGRGARVARRVVADARIDDGWWEDVALGYDWVRRESARDEEWADRDNWREWFDDYHGDDAPVDADSDRFRRVREAFLDERLDQYVSDGEVADRTHRGHVALAEHLDPAAVADAHDPAALLDELDDDAVRAYLAERGELPGPEAKE
ncbi:FAD-dependent oxidoreductase [Halobaculum sp. EA56]|uniref:FAD-dependent oxidoreductase n=1 Tax=Halobaculum sp. EA56 TaxID=3421648 RepID=UPI003EB9AFAA